MSTFFQKKTPEHFFIRHLLHMHTEYQKNNKTTRQSLNVSPTPPELKNIIYSNQNLTPRHRCIPLFTFSLLYEIFVNVRVRIANIPAKYCSVLLKTLYAPTPYNLFSWRNCPPGSLREGGGYPYIAITSLSCLWGK